MKILILITAVFALFLTGCSSTYKVSNFSSKEKFYTDLKNATKNKNITVIFLNDSTITSNNGVEILNDTLYSIKYVIINQYRKIALAGINFINYTSLDYKSGDILLKSNELLKAEKIKIISDSVEFTEIKMLMSRDNISSINNVKEVRYKNHWIGIIPGFLVGIPAGFILGLTRIIPTYVTEGDDPPGSVYDNTGAMVIGIPLGILIGSALGGYIGYTYTYQFNP